MPTPPTPAAALAALRRSADSLLETVDRLRCFLCGDELTPERAAEGRTCRLCERDRWGDEE